MTITPADHAARIALCRRIILDPRAPLRPLAEWYLRHNQRAFAQLILAVPRKTLVAYCQAVLRWYEKENPPLAVDK